MSVEAIEIIRTFNVSLLKIMSDRHYGANRRADAQPRLQSREGGPAASIALAGGDGVTRSSQAHRFQQSILWFL
jgi:hypothetical protein